MRKTHIHIDLVPVAVARKILKRQQALAARNGKRKLAADKKPAKKATKTANGQRIKSTRQEVRVA